MVENKSERGERKTGEKRNGRGCRRGERRVSVGTREKRERREEKRGENFVFLVDWIFGEEGVREERGQKGEKGTRGVLFGGRWLR
jgi:hypothetical protein